MQYKDKSFTGEGFKASNYKLYSLRKNQLCSSVVIRVLGSAFCFKRTDSALSRPSECFTGVVTSLFAVFSEEDHDTWTICHHLKPTWVVGLPLCVKWKIYSLAKSFICLNAIQPAWISSKCLPSAFDLTLAGFQGRYILLFCLIISSTQRYLAVPGLLCLLFISGISWVPGFLSFMNLTSLYPSYCVQQMLLCAVHTLSIGSWLPEDGISASYKEQFGGTIICQKVTISESAYTVGEDCVFFLTGGNTGIDR